MCVPDVLVTDTFLAVKERCMIYMYVPDVLVTNALYLPERAMRRLSISPMHVKKYEFS